LPEASRIKYVNYWQTTTDNKLKIYKVFKISSKPFLPDILSGLLWELEITGVNENDDVVIAVATEYSPVNEGKISELLEKLVDQNVIKEFSVAGDILQEKNWNQLWEKSREVIHISERIVIKPTFKEYESTDDEIVITLDPKMSFGTGEHESTKLAVRLMEKYIKAKGKVLDVGSGTGILSIAAIKMGAAFAVAVDNDPWCYENCIENCALNNVEERINVVEGEIDIIPEEDFDLVLANIQINILLLISEKIKTKLKNNGIVVLSGLMLNDEKEIINHYQSIGFKFIEKKVIDEWIAIVFKME
jgi:ribosomal protein L11 methyltransferase